MKDIYLGKNTNGENIYLNLEKEGIRFILLVGDTGSGKSVFHNNLYKELSEKHSPDEIGFIFMDMTQVNFGQWKSEYLVIPTLLGTTVEMEKAFNLLENLKDEKRTIIIHIEEADMVYHDRKKFEKGLDNVIYNNKNIIIVFSTSRANPWYINDWMSKYIDCKVVFKCWQKGVSENLLGSDIAFNFKQPGERILAYSNKQMKCFPFGNGFNFRQPMEKSLACNSNQIKCIPFSEEERKELEEFKL